MPTSVALMKVMKEGRQELAFFDFAARIPVPSDEERAVAVLHDYDRRHDELWDIPRQDAAGTSVRLLSEANDDDPFLANYIRACGDLGLDRAIPFIAKHVGHADPKVVRAVVRSFGQVMAINYVGWMASFATHPDPEMRREAANALGKILSPTVPPLLDAFAAADPTLVPLVAFGKRKIACFTENPSEASIHELIRLQLGSPDYEDLATGAEYVAKALDDLVKDASAPTALRVRALHVMALGRLPLPDTYLWVIAEPRATMPEALALEAIFAMGLLRMRSAQQPLLELVRTGEPRVRRAAIVGLAKIGRASTLEPLLADGWDLEEGRLRPAIVEAARELAKLDGAPLLASALTEDRRAPSDALLFLDEQRVTRGPRLDELSANLHSEVPEARRDAVLLLAFFGPPAAASRLRELGERETDLDIKDLALRGVARLQRP